jgi:murein DD-endopeptidase MepM/ murein hydrolase activator NlpD
MRPVDVKYPVSQRFGEGATQGVAPNPDPNSGMGYYVYLYGNYQPWGHAGEDIATPVGVDVHAITAGTVLWADWGYKLPGDESDAGYRRRWYLYKNFPGICTLIQHDGWISVYAHLNDAYLNPGDRVAEGTVIGRTGDTKDASSNVSPHLHVEALVDLSYRSGGGLIYGRTDPSKFYGDIAPAADNEEPILHPDQQFFVDLGIPLP